MKCKNFADSPTDDSPADIKKLAAAALRWAIFARIGVQIIRWSATIIVIRLLTPNDYGTMAMAMAVVAFASLFNELGVRLVIVRHAGLTTSQIGSLQVFVAGLNILLCLIAMLTAPYASLLYGHDITDVLRICALTFLTYAIGFVQESLLVRVMDFKKRAYAETASQLGGSIVSLLLAFFGFGVWALVVGFLTVRTISAALFYHYVPKRYPWRFRYTDIQPFIGYASGLSLQQFIAWVPTHLIPMVIGIIHNQHMLGFYVVGQNLSFLPLTKFGSAFQQVGIATYAKSQTETQQVTGALRKSLCYLSSIFFPYMFFVIVIAPLAVEVVLGPTWFELTTFIQIMVLALPLRACNLQLIAAVNVIGDTKVGLKINAIQAVLSFTMVIAGSFSGLAGAAFGWALSVPITHALGIWLTRHCLPMGIWDLILAYLRPATVGIGIVIIIASALPLTEQFRPFLQLAIMSVLGVVGFVLLSLIINRSQFMEIVRFIRL